MRGFGYRPETPLVYRARVQRSRSHKLHTLRNGRSMNNKIKNLRSRAYVNQHGKCCYCGHHLWDGKPESLPDFARKHNLTTTQAKQLRCTAEHLTPRSEGGSDSEANIAAACITCNWRRHARPVARVLLPASYRDYVRRRLARGGWHGFMAQRRQRAT